MSLRLFSLFVLVFSLAGPVEAGRAWAGSPFLRAAKESQLPHVHRAYLFRHRVSERVGRFVSRIPLFERLLRHRQLYAASNETLSKITEATRKGYLEVIVPADRGHVYYRLGERVLDFSEKGLRAGPVRPIDGDRYGFFVRITPQQEERIGAYFRRLEETGGAELGKYAFNGVGGFHCVTFMLREQIGERAGEHLVKLLGGNRMDGRSMPRFARFMLEKAKNVEGVVVYKKHAVDATQLSTLELALMSSHGLRKARKEELRRREAAAGE